MPTAHRSAALAEQVDLGVVRRDDHDLAGGRRPQRAAARPRRDDALRLLERLLPAAIVLDRDAAQARAERRRPRRADRVGLQPPLVELLRDVAADVGVQPERPLEEEAAVGRDRRVAAEQVLQHGGAAAVRVRALEHLGELLRVADEDDVARAGRPSRARRRARPGRPRR